ncbi:MAG: sulfatase-like hydrolase/transferase, partial [Synergistaceae bacterium]|nr:sulfatase-like hydrolase/transferase [Synergistaceae bacterium]
AVYDVSYNVPVPSTYNFDLTAGDVPEGIKLYYDNWSNLTGSFDVRAETATGMSFKELWEDYQNYYFNCIQDNDDNLMKIIDALKNNEMLDDTIIIFTADHGEMHGSHGLKGKGGFVYENNIHVPMIIVHPDFNGGAKISAVTSHIDIAATLAEIGRRTSENLPGKSFLPLLKGTQKSARDGALFCYEMLSMSAPNFIKADGSGVSYNFGKMGRGMLRGLITNSGYKFARYFKPGEFNTPETFDALFASNDVQLFDTNKDPDELNNLASPENRKEHEALIMELNSLMNDIVEEEVNNNDNGEHVLKPLLEYLDGE